MTRDAEKLGAGISLTAKASKPLTTAAENGRGDSDSLDIGNGGGSTKETDTGGEWGFQSGLASLALN